LVHYYYYCTAAGTIFAVYEKADGSIGTIEDVMRAGVDIKVSALIVVLQLKAYYYAL
jgi:fructose-1,6-bisphosphatase